MIGTSRSPRGVRRLRLERPLQHLGGRTPERVLGRNAGDLLRRRVPEDDLPSRSTATMPSAMFARIATLRSLLERDALVELRVRERGGRARGEREQRLDLLLAPRPRLARVDGEHAERRALRAGERHAEIARRCRRRASDRARAGAGRRRRSRARRASATGRRRRRATRSPGCACRAPPARRDRPPPLTTSSSSSSDPDRARIGVERAPAPARRPRRARLPDRARSSAAGRCA